MRHRHTARALVLATAAATLFATAPLAVADATAASATGYCYGVNACKGKSSCKTAHNACQGQGFVDGVSAETCAQLSGRFKTEDPMKKG